MDRREKLKDSFLRFLRTMGDLMLLNWLCFFCCLPVITVGPTLCAMYSVSLKLARGEHCHTLRDFFRAFRENFRPGLVLGLIALVMAAMAVGDYLFALGLTGTMQKLYTVLAVLLLEPKDLPRIAKKSAKMYLGVRSFLKTNWLALAEDAEENKEE